MSEPNWKEVKVNKKLVNSLQEGFDQLKKSIENDINNRVEVLNRIKNTISLSNEHFLQMKKRMNPDNG